MIIAGYFKKLTQSGVIPAAFAESIKSRPQIDYPAWFAAKSKSGNLSISIKNNILQPLYFFSRCSEFISAVISSSLRFFSFAFCCPYSNILVHRSSRVRSIGAASRMNSDLDRAPVKRLTSIIHTKIVYVKACILVSVCEPIVFMDLNFLRDQVDLDPKKFKLIIGDQQP